MYLLGAKGKTAPNWVNKNTYKLEIFTYVRTTRKSNPDLLQQ